VRPGHGAAGAAPAPARDLKNKTRLRLTSGRQQRVRGAEPPAGKGGHARARLTPRANCEPPPTSPPTFPLRAAPAPAPTCASDPSRAVADRSGQGGGPLDLVCSLIAVEHLRALGRLALAAVLSEPNQRQPTRVRACFLASAMVASSSSSSTSSVPSSAHRRRLADVERAAAADCCGVPSDGSDDGSERRGHGAGAGGVKALLLFARRSGCKRVPVAGLAWVRSAVACLLGVAVVLVLVTSSRGGAAGGAGRPLVRRVDAGDGGALGWREENLTAVARRPPDPPVSALAAGCAVTVLAMHYRPHPASFQHVNHS
jgi:hypothetical protein